MVTTITQGKNSRSRFQFRSMTAEVNADINQLQKIKDPDCPPHNAVSFKYNGMVLLETA